MEGLWLGTFHALCARMLRRFAERVGLTSTFSILDTDDQMRLLKQIMEAARVDIKRWPANALMAQIQRWKDKGFLPGEIPASEFERVRQSARPRRCTRPTRTGCARSTPRISAICCCSPCTC